MNSPSGWRVTCEMSCKGRRILASTLLFCLPLAPVLTSAAPPRSRVAAQKNAAPAFHADVIVPPTQPAAADLLLKKEDTARADALAAFAEGVIAEQGADSEKAIEAYQKALNLDPGYTELALRVAYELARRGDVTAGIALLKDAIKSSPKEPLPYLYLSQLYAKHLKKPELALKYAQQALELDPSNSTSYLAVYELYAATGQQKKADQVLDRAMNLQVEDPMFWIQLGELYTKLFLKEDGSSAPESFKRMNAVHQKALALAKDDPEVMAKVADYYVSSRQIKEAISLYLKILKLKQTDPDTSDSSSEPEIASIRDKLAKSLRDNGQRDEAIAMLQQLIKENPLRFETYELLAELCEEKGDIEGALGNYQQVLLLDSALPMNYLRVADLQLRLKYFEKAIETLSEARRKFRNLPQLTYSLAIAYSQAKKNQESVTTFEEARREAENAQADMLDARFYFAYGAAAEQAGLIEKASELLKKSIELDPGSAQAYNYLGYMWVDRGEHLDEAGDLIKRAIEMEPDNAAYIDSLGWWYFKKGDPQKALEQLQKAAANIKPEDAVVFDHLGDAYAELNNVAQALIYWRKAIALEPDNKEAITDKIEDAKQKTAHQQAPAATPVPAVRE